LNLIKFLKTKEPDRRVFGGRFSDATTFKRRREYPGLFSSAFKAASAVEGQ